MGRFKKLAPAVLAVGVFLGGCAATGAASSVDTTVESATTSQTSSTAEVASSDSSSTSGDVDWDSLQTTEGDAHR